MAFLYAVLPRSFSPSIYPPPHTFNRSGSGSRSGLNLGLGRTQVPGFENYRQGDGSMTVSVATVLIRSIVKLAQINSQRV